MAILKEVKKIEHTSRGDRYYKVYKRDSQSSPHIEEAYISRHVQVKEAIESAENVKLQNLDSFVYWKYPNSENEVEIMAVEYLDCEVTAPIDPTTPGELGFQQVSPITTEEDAGVVSYPVLRLGGNDGAVTVDYVITSEPNGVSNQGSLLGDDLTSALSGTLTWGDGDESVKNVNITHIDNATVNGNRDLKITLINVTGGATLGSMELVVTILDNEVAPVFNGTIPDYAFNEGQQISDIFLGAFFTNADTFVLTPSDPPGLDFSESTGVLSGTPSSTGGFTLQVVASNADGSTSSNEFTATVSGVGTGPGELSIAQANFDVSEGAPAATVTVNRNGGTDGEVTCTTNMFSGTATNNVDFTKTTPTLTWEAGDPEPKTFDITLINDQDIEPNEFFNITIGNPTNVTNPANPPTIGRGSATVTILDNDPEGDLPEFSGIIQPLGFTEDVAISPIDFSTYFTFATSYTISPQEPEGLVMDAVTGIMDGTPTAPLDSTIYRVTGVNIDGSDVSNNFAIEVIAANAPPQFNGPVPNLQVSEGVTIAPIDLSIYFTSATSYSLPNRPDGLDFDTTTAILTGTATTQGDTTLVLTGTNINGSTNSTPFNAEVLPPPAEHTFLTDAVVTRMRNSHSPHIAGSDPNLIFNNFKNNGAKMNRIGGFIQANTPGNALPGYGAGASTNWQSTTFPNLVMGACFPVYMAMLVEGVNLPNRARFEEDWRCAFSSAFLAIEGRFGTGSATPIDTLREYGVDMFECIIIPQLFPYDDRPKNTFWSAADLALFKPKLDELVDSYASPSVATSMYISPGVWDFRTNDSDRNISLWAHMEYAVWIYEDFMPDAVRAQEARALRDALWELILGRHFSASNERGGAILGGGSQYYRGTNTEGNAYGSSTNRTVIHGFMNRVRRGVPSPVSFNNWTNAYRSTFLLACQDNIGTVPVNDAGMYMKCEDSSGSTTGFSVTTASHYQTYPYKPDGVTPSPFAMTLRNNIMQKHVNLAFINSTPGSEEQKLLIFLHQIASQDHRPPANVHDYAMLVWVDTRDPSHATINNFHEAQVPLSNLQYMDDREILHVKSRRAIDASFFSENRHPTSESDHTQHRLEEIFYRGKPIMHGAGSSDALNKTQCCPEYQIENGHDTIRTISNKHIGQEFPTSGRDLEDGSRAVHLGGSENLDPTGQNFYAIVGDDRTRLWWTNRAAFQQQSAKYLVTQCIMLDKMRIRHMRCITDPDINVTDSQGNDLVGKYTAANVSDGANSFYREQRWRMPVSGLPVLDSGDGWWKWDNTAWNHDAMMKNLIEPPNLVYHAFRQMDVPEWNQGLSSNGGHGHPEQRGYGIEMIMPGTFSDTAFSKDFSFNATPDIRPTKPTPRPGIVTQSETTANWLNVMHWDDFGASSVPDYELTSDVSGQSGSGCLITNPSNGKTYLAWFSHDYGASQTHPTTVLRLINSTVSFTVAGTKPITGQFMGIGFDPAINWSVTVSGRTVTIAPGGAVAVDSANAIVTGL